MRWRRRRGREPVPPTDVKLVLADGRIIPVDTVYFGRNPDGVDVWIVETEHRRILNIRIAELPPQTLVGVHFL